ncbi:phage tail protein, partial [Bacillus cereus]|nr:phage tail protein [Bacillus cereus]
MLDIGIDNQWASEYGICIVGRPVIPPAEQDVEL